MSKQVSSAAYKGRKDAREEEKQCGRDITDMDIRSAVASAKAQGWVGVALNSEADDKYTLYEMTTSRHKRRKASCRKTR